MFIDIIQYFKSKNCFISRCDACGALWAATKDEIKTYANEKDGHTISGYVCPCCDKNLLLPENFK